MAGGANSSGTRSPEETRERRLKIFIAVGGVLLLGLVAFQLPGLLSSGSSTHGSQATPSTVAAVAAAAPAPVSASAATPVDKLPRSIADTRARDVFAPQIATVGGTSASVTAQDTPRGPAVRAKDFVVKDVFAPQIAAPAATAASSTVIKTATGTTRVIPSAGSGGYIVVLDSISGIGALSRNQAAHAVVAARNAGLKNVVANDAVPGQSGSGPHFTIYTGPWTTAGSAQSELVRALRNGYPRARSQQLPSSSGKGF
jgi:hypothetical protein